MHRFKPIVLATLAVAALFGSGAPLAAAAPGPGKSGNVVDAWFYGTATSGPPAPYMPININPADITVRPDGAIGIGYTYLAQGQASGAGRDKRVAGTFVYQEHGYLFFRNPADPTTYVGSQYVSGTFTLRLNWNGASVAIADTNPAAYTSGVTTIALPDKGLTKALREAIGRGGLGRGSLTQSGMLTYGYFTFTDAYGTFTGYATPDFRQFAIEIKFDCAAC